MPRRIRAFRGYLPFVLGALLALLTLGSVAFAQGAPNAPSVTVDATRLDGIAQQVDAAVAAGDWPTAQREWREFGETWLDVEDPFRDQSRDGYTAIESAMVEVGDALRASPPATDAVRQGLSHVRAELAPFIAGTAQSTAPSSSGIDLPAEMATLDRALAAAQRNDGPTALAEMQRFNQQWPDVEGAVKTRSSAVYTSTENRMGEALSLLKANPPRTTDAVPVMQAMRADLQPFAESPARYGAADAAIILLREGLEALLVVAALVAYLARTGNSDKQRWIWGGAGVGVLVSVLVAVVIQRVFASVSVGASRELLEGITGLVAAGLLLYVSYWLHSKSNLAAWQKFVREKTSAALAGGGMFSLATISFLSVFREGAETALFYIGIAPSIEMRDLALGVGIGVLGLAIIGVLILVFGMRIPLRPFFLVSSLLLYYLAFKFVGTGIHALQVAGILGSTPAAIPTWDAIGLFPTWETTLPQLLLLLLAVGVVVWSRMHSNIARLVTSPSH